jgi:hypothetical protein
LILAEIRVGGTRGEQQRVVLDAAAVGEHHGTLVGHHGSHFAQAHFRIALPTQNMAQGGSNIRGGKPGSGNLIEQGLEQVMIAAVDQRHAKAWIVELSRGPEAREATADDD